MLGAIAGAALPMLGKAIPGMLSSGVTGLFGLARGRQEAGAADRYMRAQERMGRMQMQTARQRLDAEVMMNRDMAKFNMAGKIGDRTAAYGYGADLDFGRQERAKRQDLGEFADMRYANTMRNMRGERDFELSGLTRNMRDQASRRRMKESLASQLAAGRGMFGPIAPVNVSDMVI